MGWVSGSDIVAPFHIFLQNDHLAVMSMDLSWEITLSSTSSGLISKYGWVAHHLYYFPPSRYISSQRRNNTPSYFMFTVLQYPNYRPWGPSLIVKNLSFPTMQTHFGFIPVDLIAIEAIVFIHLSYSANCMVLLIPLSPTFISMNGYRGELLSFTSADLLDPITFCSIHSPFYFSLLQRFRLLAQQAVLV